MKRAAGVVGIALGALLLVGGVVVGILHRRAYDALQRERTAYHQPVRGRVIAAQGETVTVEYPAAGATRTVTASLPLAVPPKPGDPVDVRVAKADPGRDTVSPPSEYEGSNFVVTMCPIVTGLALLTLGVLVSRSGRTSTLARRPPP